ncbi:quinone-dependent dihydroorotate dehydrogenase [bacterium]|nr:quinone-dependent dihydroorotate dehydrogenase [bacterium]
MNFTRLVLHKFDPEKTHDLAVGACIAAAKVPFLTDVIESLFGLEDSRLTVSMGNLNFPNPIGLAAGFDKDGVAVPILQALGFGFIEVGTVTPKSQPGNEKPRLFRLRDENAIINRMGFNNHGIDCLVNSLQKIKKRVPIGINLGKNKQTPIEHAVDDYLIGLTKAWDCADYFTINISSPNTENLRDLQQEQNLKPLIETIIKTRNRLASESKKYKQIWLKIAPDLSDDDILQICEIVMNSGIDAMVVSNTTISRPKPDNPLMNQAGGLSGKPLLNLSNEVLRKVKAATGGKIGLIGVGGIFEAEDIKAKFDLGADLVQLYTSFVFNGPRFIKKLKLKLVQALE